MERNVRDGVTLACQAPLGGGGSHAGSCRSRGGEACAADGDGVRAPPAAGPEDAGKALSELCRQPAHCAVGRQGRVAMGQGPGPLHGLHPGRLVCYHLGPGLAGVGPAAPGLLPQPHGARGRRPARRGRHPDRAPRDHRLAPVAVARPCPRAAAQHLRHLQPDLGRPWRPRLRTTVARCVLGRGRPGTDSGAGSPLPGKSAPASSHCERKPLGSLWIQRCRRCGHTVDRGRAADPRDACHSSAWHRPHQAGRRHGGHPNVDRARGSGHPGAHLPHHPRLAEAAGGQLGLGHARLPCSPGPSCGPLDVRAAARAPPRCARQPGRRSGARTSAVAHGPQPGREHCPSGCSA
mmetsp:Transcript_12549/g.39189  ORF Transcript_12549/g.39189 Transcript_12549/m.39189 type:complete len:349 (+) Transcript_12549:699-1745(+)